MYQKYYSIYAVSYTHLDVYKRQDKGNTLVIMDTDSYNAKVHEFISNHNIRQLKSDPTDKYIKNLNQCINKLSLIHI